MNAKELKAIISRLNRIKNGESLKSVYGADDIGGITAWECWYDDKTNFVNAQLATVQLDDDEPIDSQYLGGKYRAINPGMRFAMCTHFAICTHFSIGLDSGSWRVATQGGETIAEVETRGQLRGLLRALGVEK